MDDLKSAFSLGRINGNLASVIGSSSAAIANFVILLGSYGIPTETDIPKEVDELIIDIESVSDEFDNAEIDPSVRDVAQRHLKILSALLKNIGILGLEPSIVEYFSLVSKLRRADVGASKTSHEATQPVWDRIEKWGKRIGAIDKIVNAGTRFANGADKVAGLLDHMA